MLIQDIAASNVYYYKCDITSPSTISSVASEIRKDVGAPTILINNAGVARGKTILDSTEKDIRFTFEVNTLSHYVCKFLSHFIPHSHTQQVSKPLLNNPELPRYSK